MEERTMNPGYIPHQSGANTIGGVMRDTRSNNAAVPNLAVKPVWASVPNPANMPNTPNMPNPPAMPKAETMPLSIAPKTENMVSMPMPKTENMGKKPNMPEYMPEKENLPGKPNMPEIDANSYKKGELPHYAPLAAGYVPYQQMNPPKYAHSDALTHGTLFPGLDLPFMNVASKSNPYAGTPLGDVMALDFAVHELRLYLDTHADDKEAFEMLKTLLKLSGEGRRKYEELYGPINLRDLERANHYTWLREPWPWEYAERMGNK